MTDVDGTLTTGSDSISWAASEVIRHLEDDGIIVGLVSGRMLPGLESLVHDLYITGPIIAGNGGVAKLKVNSESVGPAVFLASKAPDFVTGHILYVDGGTTTW